ncbi:hypothetical protein [Stenotrophomonas sp. NPDC077659]|uniref:hypothetical protein n=1 Tax=Stenotrophomonas sp. NPDC077659 TaxID=3390694 RepID=UPI003CFC063A
MHRICTLSAALLLAMLATAPAWAASAPPPTEGPSGVARSDYETAWQSAISTAASGNLLGAMIEVERLMDDPRFERLTAAQQSESAQLAGTVARMQGEPVLARRYLDRSRAAQPDNAQTLLELMYLELADDHQDQAIDLLIQACTHSRTPVEVDEDTAGFLDQTLREQPPRRLALLQALFDNGWKGDGPEPSRFWLTLARLQVDHGQGSRVPATLARIDTPLEVITLRSDKRFDRYVDRSSARFDAEASARRERDVLRLAGLLDSSIDAELAAFSFAQLLAGENEQIVQFTDALAQSVDQGDRPSPAEAKWVAWLLQHRMMALRRLDRMDESLTAARMAQMIGTLTSDSVTHTMTLASMLSVTGHAQQAQALLADLEGLLPYGEALRAYLQFTTALDSADTAAAEQARAKIISLRDEAPLFYREMLTDEGDLDGAAAVLIAQLESPEERGETLLSLQDLRVYPSLPVDASSDRHWRALKQRDDVRAAIARVGRIEQYPLFSPETSR